MDSETARKVILSFMFVCTVGAVVLFMLPFFEEPPSFTSFEAGIIDSLNTYHEQFNDLPEDIYDLEKEVEVNGEPFGPCLMKGTIDANNVTYQKIDARSYELNGKKVQIE